MPNSVETYKYTDPRLSFASSIRLEPPLGLGCPSDMCEWIAHVEHTP